MFLEYTDLQLGSQREFPKLLQHAALVVKMGIHVLKRDLKKPSHLAHKLRMSQKRGNMLKEKSQEEEKYNPYRLLNQMVSQIQVLQLITYYYEDHFA